MAALATTRVNPSHFTDYHVSLMLSVYLIHSSNGLELRRFDCHSSHVIEQHDLEEFESGLVGRTREVADCSLVVGSDLLVARMRNCEMSALVGLIRNPLEPDLFSRSSNSSSSSSSRDSAESTSSADLVTRLRSPVI